MATRNPRIAIIGAGMSGICVAATLKRAGINTFRIFEKGKQVGGTWRDNTYPGLSCDVPSRFYQFTFAPNPEWSHFFSPGAEIWEYFDAVTDRFGIRSHISFGTEIQNAEWRDGKWEIRTADGAIDTFDFVIAATGILHHPHYPDIEGLASFSGASFHSARWDHRVQLTGKRLGLIGTGSTGAQIVAALADQVGHLTMFQRTPQWIAPLPNFSYSAPVRAAYRRVPGLNQVSYRATQALFETVARGITDRGWERWVVNRFVRSSLESVKDPELRRKLTPDYEPGCKRLIISSGFYPAVQRDNVEVVTDGIDHIEPEGVVTRDGTLHELDVLVLATGFDAHAYVRPINVTGENGLTLEEAWRDGPRAYHTVAMPGFPNFFLLMGPHSPVGNFSLTAIAETQTNYVMQWIDRWRAGEIAAVAPTKEATDRFNATMKAAAPQTIWASGCDSWYLGKDGLPEIWPWHPDRHRALLRTPKDADFHITRTALVPQR